MAEFPALPLFTDAYLADTMHLSTLQHGAYFLMLLVAWRSKGCTLSDNDDYMAKITRLEKRTWMANKDVLLAFWKRDTAGNFYQGRLKDERNYVEQVRNRNAQAGKASALKRLNRGSTYVEKPLQPNDNHSATPTPILTPTPTPTPTPILKSSSPYPFKTGLDDDDDFALRAIQELEGMPVLNNRDTTPIKALIDQGYDLHGEIIPAIKATMRKGNGKYRPGSWTYLASAVVENRAGAANGNAAAVEPINWGERMRLARKFSAWQEDWGPFPNQPGCTVPFQFIVPTDGKGWKIWNPYE